MPDKETRDFIENSLEKFNSCRDQECFVKVLNEVEKQVFSYPINLHRHLLYQDLLWRLGLIETLSGYTHLAAEAPEDPKALFLLAITPIKEPFEQREIASKIKEIDPDFPYLDLLYAYIYLKEKDNSMAAKHATSFFDKCSNLFLIVPFLEFIPEDILKTLVPKVHSLLLENPIAYIDKFVPLWRALVKLSNGKDVVKSDLALLEKLKLPNNLFSLTVLIEGYRIVDDLDKFVEYGKKAVSRDICSVTPLALDINEVTGAQDSFEFLKDLLFRCPNDLFVASKIVEELEKRDLAGDNSISQIVEKLLDDFEFSDEVMLPLLRVADRWNSEKWAKELVRWFIEEYDLYDKKLFTAYLVEINRLKKIGELEKAIAIALKMVKEFRFFLLELPREEASELAYLLYDLYSLKGDSVRAILWYNLYLSYGNGYRVQEYEKVEDILKQVGISKDEFRVMRSFYARYHYDYSYSKNVKIPTKVLIFGLDGKFWVWEDIEQLDKAAIVIVNNQCYNCDLHITNLLGCLSEGVDVVVIVVGRDAKNFYSFKDRVILLTDPNGNFAVLSDIYPTTVFLKDKKIKKVVKGKIECKSDIDVF